MTTFTTNLTWTGLGLNPELRTERKHRSQIVRTDFFQIKKEERERGK
jgi:hypothetical protein